MFNTANGCGNSKPMKKIIVPVDFSEHSEYALETAAALAQKSNAELLVLHMLEIANAVLTSTHTTNETLFFLKLAEKRFENFLDKDYLKDIQVTPIVKHFKVFSEVNDVAKEHDADLIIMGSHGASGIKEMLVGSNTEKVVRHSEIPVLIVKHNPVLMDLENVVFACNFSEEATKSYTDAKKFFDRIGSTIHLVHVNTPNTGFRSTPEIEKSVATFLMKVDGNLDKLNAVKYVSDYTVEQGILNFANTIGADLISVATHGRTGLAHLIEGSISEDIANHSALPVMTFKM